MDALQQLLNTRDDIWRGHARPRVPTLPTGQAELDACLPDHGWPCGQLIELQPTQLGCGELSLLMPALAKQSQQGKPVMLISPPWVPCPQALMQAGVELKHVLVIRQTQHTLWVAEQALKSGLCGLVVMWPEPTQLTQTAMRRLQLSCEYGLAPCFLISNGASTLDASTHALRLIVAPGPKVMLQETHRVHSDRSVMLDFNTYTSEPTCAG